MVSDKYGLAIKTHQIAAEKSGFAVSLATSALSLAKSPGELPILSVETANNQVLVKASNSYTFTIVRTKFPDS